MELQKIIDPSKVIEKLLQDNKKLRLELALLTAYDTQLSKNEQKRPGNKKNKSIIENLSEEDLSKISPQALEALRALKIE